MLFAASADLPLVTIVALCHNHARFIHEALQSVLAQTYPRLEVWLVDDASTDGSQEILRRYAAEQPEWHLLLLPENVRNCRAFNQAYRRSEGEFIIDFATDDVLLPERVALQVAFMQAKGPNCGMAYHDVELIDEESRHVRNFYRRDAAGLPVHPRPVSGQVFAEVLRRFFISTPSMMFRRATLDAIGGYDEALIYEDFDFWVQASRDWEFHYQDELLTRKRLHPKSMSKKAYQPGDPYLASTIRTCEKALALCRTDDDRAALATRLRWELQQAVRHRNFEGAQLIYQFMRGAVPVSLLDRLLGASAKLLA
jgi:glycosyltransferase involved in cell wall biosynthesis